MSAFLKRLTSLVLTAVLLAASLAVTIPVTAQESAGVYPTYEEAKDGDLLYTADFSGTDGRYKPALLNTDSYVSASSSWSAIENGAALSITVPEKKDSHIGGAVSGLPLNSSTVYTITYDVERTADSLAGLHVDFNNSSTAPRGRSGFGGYITNYAYFVAGTNKSGYKTMATCTKVQNPEVGAGKPQSYKVVVDGTNNTISGAVLSQNGAYVTIIRTKVDKFFSDTLNLIFRVYNGYGHATVFRNVNVYKGDVAFDTNAVSNNGELLLDIRNVSENATGAQGVIYKATENCIHSTAKLPTTLKYNAETNENVIVSTENPGGLANTTTAIGGTTNLPLGKGHQYTLEYKVKFLNASSGGSVRFAYGLTSHSDGFYMNNSQGCFAYGTGTGDAGNVPYKKFTDSMKQTDGNGYFHVSVEIDGYQVTAYVNGEQLFTHDTLTNPKGVLGYTTDYLTIVLQQYLYKLPAEATEYISYKDIKVYSGLTVSNGYITMKNGDVVEPFAYPKSTGCMLPLPESTGKMFKGWAVDGKTDALLPSGAMLPADAKSVEAVWGKDYLKAFAAQFKENDNNTQDMRVVGIVDSRNYAEIGYRMTIRYTVAGEEKVITEDRIPLRYVYQNLSAKYGTEKVTVSSLGYDPAIGYLTAFTIKGLPTNAGTVTVELTAYSMTLEQDAPVYQTESAVITLINGVVQ